jgi:hypothetical protein
MNKIRQSRILSNALGINRKNGLPHIAIPRSFPINEFQAGPQAL